MSSVCLSSPTNSTIFTTCCETAICDDQQKCPSCGQDVYPFYEGMPDDEREEMAGGYFYAKTRNARWNRAYQ